MTVKTATVVLFLTTMTCMAQTPKEIARYLNERQAMCEVTPDSLFPTLRTLEKWKSEAKDSVVWAVLSECLGRMYESKEWVSQHNLHGEKIEEWGHGQWIEAGRANRIDARRPMRALRKAKAKDWRPVVQLAEKKRFNIQGSKWFDGDLLHVLHSNWPTEAVARFYLLDAFEKGGKGASKNVSGELLSDASDTVLTGYANDAAVVARLHLIEGDSLRLDSLLRVSEASPKVSDDVRAQVYTSLIYSLRDDDTVVARCEDCIARYGRLQSVNAVRNHLYALRQPMLRAQIPQLCYPGAVCKIPVEYRNVDRVTMRLGQNVLTFATDFPAAHATVRDTLLFAAPAGCALYDVILAPHAAVDVAEEIRPDTGRICVSPLKLLRMDYPKRGENMSTYSKDDGRFVVVDAITGAPVPNKEVLVFDSVVSNRWRETTVSYARIVGDPQPPVPCQKWYGGFSWDASYTDINVYTDRAIYRPGQTVHVSGLVYNRRHWDAEVVADTTLTLSVYDTKRKVVFRDTLTTDAFGCVNTSFNLPAGAPLGDYWIALGTDGVGVRVEEYKRPTYEVRFDDNLHGDTVQLQVLSYNGQPLRGARVTGKVCLGYPLWRYNVDYDRTIDTLYTTDDGRVSFRVELPDTTSLYENKSLNVSVMVVSATGETREATHTYLIKRHDDEQSAQNMHRMERMKVFGDSIVCLKWSNDTIYPDRPVVLSLQCLKGEAYVFFAMSCNDTCFHERTLHMDGRSPKCEITVPYDMLDEIAKKSDGIGFSLAFVHDGQYYDYSKDLYRAQPDMSLRWRWETFRDYVTPGNEETWSGILTTPDGRPADANAMFTVYDASLDGFMRHAWRLNVYRPYYISSSPWTCLSMSPKRHISMWFSNMSLDVPTVAYHHIDPRLLFFDMGIMGIHGRGMMLYKNKAIKEVSAPMMDANITASRVTGLHEEMDEAIVENEEFVGLAKGGNTVLPTPVVARSDFRETAYFAPIMRTDKDGRLRLRFTLPDCMTTWNLLGVAHTRDMMTTEIKASTVARKPLMTSIDVPRCLRTKDKASTSITVQNLIQRDARTDVSDLPSVRSQRQNSVHRSEPSGAQNVSNLRQTVTLNIDLLDASNEKIIKTERHRFALERDTVLHFSFEANHPHLIVRAVAVSDKGSDGEQRDILVLDDSEWVAKSADMMCRGAGEHVFEVDTLFDDNAYERRMTVQYTEQPIWAAIDVLRHISAPPHDDAISLHTAYYAASLKAYIYERYNDNVKNFGYNPTDFETQPTVFFERLSQLRNDDGGYAWFPGFSSSEWITLEVATTFARLQKMTGKSTPHWSETVAYLRQCNAERVKSMKQDECEELPMPALQYLYILALTGEQLSADDRYLLDRLKPVCSRERLAIGTVVLQLLGRTSAAEAMRKDLRKYIVSAGNQGAFFSYLRGSFVSIDRKLLDHIYAMEALADDALLSDMRRWLLQQKRVQAWENPLCNAAAVYALLIGDTYDLAPAAHDRLRIDDAVVMNIVDGRCKETISVVNPIKRVVVEKKNPVESWGAVYVESRMSLDDVRPYGNGLAVRRYIDDGKDTRIIIDADRDYECVHVTVPRPACIEPADVLSHHTYQGGLSYYREVHDAYDDLFIERLPKGTYTLMLRGFAVRPGTYSTGVTTIRCMYAPEFCGNTANATVTAD